MRIEADRIRGYRLHAHHLDRKASMEQMIAAAGACGLQNTPPGSWETALFNRLEGCTQQALQDALYREKTLLQAWSYRGAPVVFPTEQRDVFLTALLAREGETPWIYTLGITGGLDYLGMPFDDLLARTKEGANYLDSHTITSKDALDKTLAAMVERHLPEEKRALWNAPSMYGSPERQTVGGAIVSFLLRPCSFSSLVVFGERRGISPTFTSMGNWLGRMPDPLADGEGELVRKFLHCYGPATRDAFMSWLGCSRLQARRLWNGVSEELEPVQVAGKPCFMLAQDMEALLGSEVQEERLMLLGAHDPYLAMRDRAVILEDASRHKTVWRFSGNPGAVLKGGRVVGIWRAKTLGDKLDLSIQLWEALDAEEQGELTRLGEEYAAFRQLSIRNSAIERL